MWAKVNASRTSHLKQEEQVWGEVSFNEGLTAPRSMAPPVVMYITMVFVPGTWKIDNCPSDARQGR
jgi:hypothetical protein